MRLPLLISASTCQDSPTIALFESDWKLCCDNDAAEFLVQQLDCSDCFPANREITIKGPCNVKVTSLTTNKPCSIYAELVRPSTGSS
jgi:hypothetical protein